MSSGFEPSGLEATGGISAAGCFSTADDIFAKLRPACSRRAASPLFGFRKMERIQSRTLVCADRRRILDRKGCVCCPTMWLHDHQPSRVRATVCICYLLTDEVGVSCSPQLQSSREVRGNNGTSLKNSSMYSPGVRSTLLSTIGDPESKFFVVVDVDFPETIYPSLVAKHTLVFLIFPKYRQSITPGPPVLPGLPKLVSFDENRRLFPGI